MPHQVSYLSYHLLSWANHVFGKTSGALKTGIAEHKSTISSKHMNYPVAAPLVEFNHPLFSLRVIGIDEVLLS